MVATPKQRQVSLDNIYHIQNRAGKSLALTTFFSSSSAFLGLIFKQLISVQTGFHRLELVSQVGSTTDCFLMGNI